MFGTLGMRGVARLAAKLSLLVACAAVSGAAMSRAAMAQENAAGVDPSRDCKTIRTCNFSRHGRVRGCLSSYSCRTCHMVRTRCNLAGRRYCQQLVCNWGG